MQFKKLLSHPKGNWFLGWQFGSVCRMLAYHVQSSAFSTSCLISQGCIPGVPALGSEGRRARNSKLYPQLHSESEATLDHMKKQSKTKEHTFVPIGSHFPALHRYVPGNH